MLQLNNISKQFTRSAGMQPVRVLDNLCLTIASGSSLAILGPSGSGKSTLLNITGTLDKPTSGNLEMDGRDLLALSGRELARFRNREIGFVFQLHHLLPQCTVWENVMLPALALKKSDRTPGTEKRARDLLGRTGLSDRMDYKPFLLSGGELQRVAVVRALVNKPRLLLADEPTGALDNQSASGLAALLLQLNREEQVTLVIVTHSTELARQTQRTLYLHNGKLEEANAKA